MSARAHVYLGRVRGGLGWETHAGHQWLAGHLPQFATLPAVDREQHNRRSARDPRQPPSSSGRASVAISAIHASHDFIVLEQFAVAGSGATLLNFSAEPLVVIHRSGQKVDSDLVNGASCLRGKAGEPCFELRWNLQIHEVSVGGITWQVNGVWPTLRTAHSAGGERRRALLVPVVLAGLPGVDECAAQVQVIDDHAHQTQGGVQLSSGPSISGPAGDRT